MKGTVSNEPLDFFSVTRPVKLSSQPQKESSIAMKKGNYSTFTEGLSAVFPAPLLLFSPFYVPRNLSERLTFEPSHITNTFELD